MGEWESGRVGEPSSGVAGSPFPPFPHSPIRIWLLAARPKTLWAGFAPVLIGTAMAWADGAFHAVSALAALALAMTIQIGTNFCNDYADFKKGADTGERQGPVRATQAGLVTPKTMFRATILLFALAFLVSLYLAYRGGWPMLVVGIVSIISGVLYTAGPRPIGYLGLGDLFVLIFFGPVAVGGTYYVQALELQPSVLVAGLAPGLLSVAILIVNNLRDIDGDTRAGKRTLAVRFGKTFVRWEYTACLAGAFLVAVYVGVTDADHRFTLLTLVLLPPAIRETRVVFAGDPGAVLNPVLARTARLLLLFSLLFSVGWVI